ncbi:TetR/AcrR family transcriptional regulator [Streptomyces purpureus]|uniref:TetR family transcriptional regulator n=1 Tax=Streptomyces purpureus TaxID=1951 RepID=A0A918H5T0_9ACTN|nr:TetR/AcrR family transcriptional regulator [Streptomyces purpureus]GGT39534.1 TetR family transcriptional regulator [Streptomyces purpureus]
MPTAREALLNAALAALATLPWSGVRMVDVAARAGVSRQTLYNEFGSKEGLARALVRREADAYLYGVDRVLAEDRAEAADRLADVAEWIVGQAHTRPLLRALLTGCWEERLPTPRPARRATFAVAVPAQRRADAGTPAPAELAEAVRDRSLAALHGSADAYRCELAVRLALSYVLAPGADGVGQLVRTAVRATADRGNPGVSGTSPTAEGQ